MSKNLNHFKISRVLGLSQHWSCRDWLFDDQDSKLVKNVKNCKKLWDYWQVETLLTCKWTSQGNVISFKMSRVWVTFQSHLGLLLVSSWSCLGLISVKFWSHLGLVLAWSGHDLITLLSQSWIGLALVSSSSCLDLVSSRGCQYFGFLWDWLYDCQGPSG